MTHVENRNDRLKHQKNKEYENRERDKFSKKKYRHNKNLRKQRDVDIESI